MPRFDPLRSKHTRTPLPESDAFSLYSGEVARTYAVLQEDEVILTTKKKAHLIGVSVHTSSRGTLITIKGGKWREVEQPALFTATGSHPKRTLWKPLEKPTRGQSWSAENQRSPPNLKKEQSEYITPEKANMQTCGTKLPLLLQPHICFCPLQRPYLPLRVRVCLLHKWEGGFWIPKIWSLRACCSLSVAGGLERRILPGLNNSKSKLVLDVTLTKGKRQFSCPPFLCPLTPSFPLTAYPMWWCECVENQPRSTLGALLAFSAHVFQFKLQKKEKRKTEKNKPCNWWCGCVLFFLLLGGTRWEKKWLSSSKLQPLLRWNLYPALPFNCHDHVLWMC